MRLKATNLSAQVFAIFILLVLALLALIAFTKYRGTSGPFVLFNVSFVLIIALALPGPRVYAYTFLSLFLFLGFWLKFTAHTIIEYPFVEPTGNFDGSGVGWDHTLMVASSAAWGVIAVRGLHLYFKRGLGSTASILGVGHVPYWYPRFRRIIWACTVVVILSVNVCNVLLSFNQAGVEPSIVLPFSLNVIISWLISIGFALWVATLIQWETSRNLRTLGYTLFVPIAEGLVSTVSQLSRSAYIFHTIPYLLVLADRRSELRMVLSRKVLEVLSTLLILGFVLGLVMVSGLRLFTYPVPSTPSASEEPTATSPTAPALATQEGVVSSMAREVLGLFVDRWVGLEGALNVSSYPGKGPELFAEGVLEDPNSGETSVYQRIAGSAYGESEQFTFLTLPGIVAVLYYSGSLLVVLFGMAAVTLLLTGVELASSRLIGNPFLLSVSGLAMANTVCQLNFPYLAGVFGVELVVTLAFIWLIQTVPAPMGDERST